ncbi:sensor histidine kinase [Actinomadura flavalba]|uniref:sensor histidine kinase n=1 Tax=Actinomadura flavalba TaxID=1120938 RepID=UPI00039BAAE1|nr:sensor histidine kinase [Actinomadura flavalba]
MNAPPHRPARVRLLDGVRAAVRPGPHDPPGFVPPVGFGTRMALLALLAGAAIGAMAGTIAIPLNVFDPPPGVTLAWLLAAAQVLPLLYAPFRPLAAWRISAPAFLLGGVLLHDRYFWPWPVTGWLAFMLLLFFVALAGHREATFGVGTVTIAGIIVPVALLGMPGWYALLLSLGAATVLIFGDAIGGRSSAEAELRRQAERHREDLARQAVLEERARIARELHDVVAHHMSVIAMQAEAAPYKIPDLPDAARETFGVVRNAARDALAETRRVVGLLRADDEGADRAPQPGLDRLEELVGAAGQAGLTVETAVVGVPRPLETGVELSAYRIVQESLSNAARYAPGARTAVELRYGAAALTVRVTDTGAAAPDGRPEARDGGGHGLVGMRERVTMLGGELTVGPTEDGGWQVEAVLPY